MPRTQQTAGLGAGRATKRRPGTPAGGLAVADSRPTLDGHDLLGSRCTNCHYPSPQLGLPWCPVCRSEMLEARFPAQGAVWSSTVVNLPVVPRDAEFGLAYVDIDDGPRILAHLADSSALPIGTRVTATGTEHGDVVMAPASSQRSDQ